MNKTPIQWTDFTSNPFMAIDKRNGERGWFCTLEDPSCRGCYARSLNMSPRGFGNGLDFVDSNVQHVEWQINWKEIAAILRRRKPCRLFPFDMIDLFHPSIPDEMIDIAFVVAALKPQITFQILTKRIDRARSYLADDTIRERISQAKFAVLDKIGLEPSGRSRRMIVETATRPFFSWPLPNVWLGTSYGRDKEAYKRLPILLDADAAIRFVSYEPAIEFVDPHSIWIGDDGRKLDWMIIGGMSGPKSKDHPFDYQWARLIVRHADDARIPLFVKQMGSNFTCNGVRVHLKDGHGGDMAEWPADVRIRQFPEDRK